MNAKLFATVLVLSSKLFTEVSSSTCCELRTTAADCDAEQNANCLWFAADDHVTERHTALTDEFQQCFSVEYAACLASDASCCGPCCGGCPPAIASDPELNNKPPGAPALSECSLGSDTANAVDAGLPAPVGEKIAEDKDASCSANTRDCWEFTQHSNDNFSPAHVRFLGVDYDTQNEACCYQYTSEYDGTNNCAGKAPEQSHLLFDIDCPVGSFSISDASSQSVGYGLDGSTCYSGIKVDTGCQEGDLCAYDICVKFANLSPGQCPLTSSWVMVKAATEFSFNSLVGGIPSCNEAARSTPKQQQQQKQLAVDDVMMHSNSKQPLIASNELMIGMALMLLLIVGGVAYKWYHHDNKHEKYAPLPDTTTSFVTMNKV
jgi:hypothetical protein